MKKSAFFLTEYINGQYQSHLYFVISDADENGEVLVVNMSTIYNINRIDKSCILNVAEHEKVTSQSFIFYGKAKAMKSKDILEGCMNRTLDNQKEISDDLLKRMQAGAKLSNFLPEGLKNFFKYF